MPGGESGDPGTWSSPRWQNSLGQSWGTLRSEKGSRDRRQATTSWKESPWSSSTSTRTSSAVGQALQAWQLGQKIPEKGSRIKIYGS